MVDVELKQKRRQYSQYLDEALEKIICRSSQIQEIEKIILFGSYAAGRRDLFTDLDLIVIMATEQDLIHRTTDLYQKLQVGVDMDLLVYTPEEFEKNRESGFLRHALETGRVVYEKKPA
jgi:predicted nucleotidyltransferase